MRHGWVAWVAMVGGWVAMVGGCGGDSDCCKIDAAAPDAFVDPYTEVARVPVTINRDIDLLWVIDDSPGILDVQTNLKNNFPNFINVLNAMEGGFPNIHLGVVTTDLGTKGADDATAGPSIGSGPGSCSGNGKAGNLQANGTTLVQGNFISDTKNTDGTRTLNYTGNLASAFAAIASVGASGCGFEQPIEAAKRALSNDPANAGFLRATANLAIFFVTDEDDCSIAHSTLFTADTTTLGPLSSFRCTRYGITCDQGGKTTDDMNAAGDKSGCHSNDASAYLTLLASYGTFFRGLHAGGEDQIFIGAIAAPPAPVAVELRAPPGGGTAVPALAHSCSWVGSAGTEVGDPAVRLAQLVTSFPRSAYTNACQQDLSGPLVDLARGVRLLIGDSCISVALASPPDCKATETSGGVSTVLPMCGTAMPCWQLVTDAQACPSSADHLKLQINRATTPPADTVDSLRCRL